MTTRITSENITDATIGTADLASSVPLNTQWQSVFTGDGSTGLTTVAGRGYFIDTTSGTVTVTLPASPSAGDVVVLKDYARTWNTNNVSLASALMDGSTTTTSFTENGQTVTLVYMDGTKGWSLVNEDTASQLQVPPSFTAATGGTVTTSGDYKIHTFTGDGCFVVSSVGNSPITPTGGPDGVDYLVVAGGGGGGGFGTYQFPRGAGGGGAGGVRLSATTFCNTGPSSPRSACVSALTITTTTYPVTVGAGGSAGPSAGPGTGPAGPGGSSIFSTITSAGGGGASPHCGTPFQGIPGGSGGAGANTATGGTGNTPPVSPPQGSNAGNGGGSNNNFAGGGGGGFMAEGTNGNPTGKGGCGGAGGGVPNAFGTSGVPSGGQYYFAGGGAGGWGNAGPGVPVNCGGIGGGGRGGSGSGAVAGTSNTGGGGGGNGGAPGPVGGTTGGKGIVIVRYKFQ